MSPTKARTSASGSREVAARTNALLGTTGSTWPARVAIASDTVGGTASNSEAGALVVDSTLVVGICTTAVAAAATLVVVVVGAIVVVVGAMVVVVVAAIVVVVTASLGLTLSSPAPVAFGSAWSTGPGVGLPWPLSGGTCSLEGSPGFPAWLLADPCPPPPGPAASPVSAIATTIKIVTAVNTILALPMQ